MTKLSTAPFENFFKHLKKRILHLLIYCFWSSTCTSHEFTTSRNRLICRMDLEQSSW